jgi:hypothetical protein
MGLRVGVVTGNHAPSAGGAWTFSATLTEALKTVQSPHAFLITALPLAYLVERTTASKLSPEASGSISYG